MGSDTLAVESNAGKPNPFAGYSVIPTWTHHMPGVPG